MSTDRIRALIEASSLGTPEAKAARESVSDEAVARCLARARKYRAELKDGDDDQNGET